MKAAVAIPVTVKCRIGVDEQDPETGARRAGRRRVSRPAPTRSGCMRARPGWKGCRPKENRDIPPLDYDRVYRLKQKHPDRFIGINGGIQTLEEAASHLAHVDGAMLGRAAYHTPGILADVDAAFFGATGAASMRRR